MAKSDRTGKRKTREQKNTNKFKLGYYLIVTDAEATERIYFEGLHKSLSKEEQNKIGIKVLYDIKYWDLVDTCQESLRLNPQYSSGWIVFDRDRVLPFDDIISQAERKGIHVGWSNPCFEIWLYAYFGQTPEFDESKDCGTNFAKVYKAKTGCQYIKSDDKLYDKIVKYGNEEQAIKLTKSRYDSSRSQGVAIPSKMTSCSTVFQLVQEIREKVTK